MGYAKMMVLVFLALVIGRTTAVIQCSQAVATVMPCEAFLFSGDSTPSGQCCSAALSLDKIALNSQQDRKAICQCFKETARSFPINLAKAQTLPKLCHLQTNVTIDPNIDCDSI